MLSKASIYIKSVLNFLWFSIIWSLLNSWRPKIFTAPKQTHAIAYGKNIKSLESKAECEKKTSERSRCMAINSFKMPWPNNALLGVISNKIGIKIKALTTPKPRPEMDFIIKVLFNFCMVWVIFKIIKIKCIIFCVGFKVKG